MPKIVTREKVFQTPWFDLVAKTTSDSSAADDNAKYYSVQSSDYVCVLPLTKNEEVILVRQYRPAIEDYSLELPAGHVDGSEAPEDAAKRELFEETGYRCEEMSLLGCLAPDTGRLANRQWCFIAKNVVFDSSGWTRPDVEVVPLKVSKTEFFNHINDSTFNHALHLSAILLALLKKEWKI